MRFGASRLAWGGLLAVAASTAAYHAYRNASFAYLRAADPVAAHALRPSDALALGHAFDRESRQGGAQQVSAADVKAARDSLISAPLSRISLRILGTDAEIRGDLAGADRLMGLSNAISRRDALTQLWMIEKSVQKDDMRGAIEHYHAALSVHPELGGVLYPVLARAIHFPEVRAALLPYVVRQTPWSIKMLGRAIAEGDPEDVVQLVVPSLKYPRSDAFREQYSALIKRLADNGKLAAATQFVRQTAPGIDQRVFQRVTVDEATADVRLGALGWFLAEGDGLSASSSDNGGISGSVEPFAKGVLAARSFSVRPGTSYAFDQVVRRGSGSGRADLRWKVLCLPASEGKLLSEIVLDPGEAQRTYRTVIAVPQSCSGLQFVLLARGDESQQSSQATIDGLAFKPAQ